MLNIGYHSLHHQLINIKDRMELSLSDRLAHHNNYKNFEALIKASKKKDIKLKIPIYLMQPHIADTICREIKHLNHKIIINDNDDFILTTNNNNMKETSDEIESNNSEGNT